MDLSLPFDRPHGWLAPLTGWVMWLGNRRVNRWTVELLDLRSEDRVIEVGFGPGAAIAMAARRANRGLLAGVDPSDSMVRQARERNRRAAAEGRLDLRRGVAEDLPWSAESFTRAFSVNAIHEWSDVREGLSELVRVLRPGGLAALTTQARWLGRDSSALDELGTIYAGFLEDVGFEAVELRRTEARPTPAISLLGRKPAWSRDVGASGRRDVGTSGRRDIGTSGRGDIGTSGHRDIGTSGHRDLGTSGWWRRGPAGGPRLFSL